MLYLSPREQDKLILSSLGQLAQRRLARGLKLNRTETVALIASQLQEFIRDGRHSVSELMQLGKEMLGRRHVLEGVAEGIHEVMVEGAFEVRLGSDLRAFIAAQGTHYAEFSPFGDPPSTRMVENALYGSFLPTPNEDTFPLPEGDPKPSDLPGAIVCLKDQIEINAGKKKWSIKVTNTGDRPIQVGSHYPFLETNPWLVFDRYLTAEHALRLDIPAGTAVRFEPGERRTVKLVQCGGKRILKGGNGLSDAPDLQQALVEGGFRVEGVGQGIMTDEKTLMDREVYASMFGPTAGDKIRLGDTNLWIQIEKDHTTYGDECKFGGGKTIRDGQGQASNLDDRSVLDTVITNAIIVDWSGIIKADIGIKDGLIAGIGKAGNPDTMDGVTEGMVVGSNTEVIAGEKMIVTAGAIDAHVHYICPDLWKEAIASGVTTLIGGGTGPAAGSTATTCTSSQWYIRAMLQSTDGVPLNFGFTGKGNDSGREMQALKDVVEAGACGLKLHEDWGSTPECIDRALQIGDEYDVQVNIHTDTLNESGFVESTIGAFKGRTIHTYHTEGAGGGHAPDIIVVCEQPNVIPSSTNPTRPYAKNTIDEHLDMLMVCHHLDRNIIEDVKFADSRIRAETIAAEDVLHDTGAISIMSSDSQAMGRIGEVIARTWRTADKMKEVRGPLEGDVENDNSRVKRYVSKYTINPAICHGVSHVIGQVAKGCLADLVIWRPENFGIKPETIVKGGFIAWAQIGEPNASIPTVQPVYGRPMWGAQPEGAALSSLALVSKASIEKGIVASYGLKKRAVAVQKCRDISKRDMKHNSALPKMTVDPEAYTVHADGVLCEVPVAEKVSLGRKYLVY